MEHEPPDDEFTRTLTPDELSVEAVVDRLWLQETDAHSIPDDLIEAVHNGFRLGASSVMSELAKTLDDQAFLAMYNALGIRMQ